MTSSGGACRGRRRDLHTLNRSIRIHRQAHYVLLYDRDCGAKVGMDVESIILGIFGVFGSHDGDAEPFVVYAYRDVDGAWRRHSASARAHGHTFGDTISSTFGGAEIYIAASKHSNFTSWDWCLRSLVDSGNCDQGSALHASDLLLIPAGEPGAHMVNDLGDRYPNYAGNYIWGSAGLLGGPAQIAPGLMTYDFAMPMPPPEADSDPMYQQCLAAAAQAPEPIQPLLLGQCVSSYLPHWDPQP